MSNTKGSLQRIFSGSEHEIIIFDAASHEVLGANDTVHRKLGYHPDEIITLAPWDLISSLTKADYHQVTSPLLEAGKAGEVFEAEHRRKDGSTYPVQTQFQYIDHQTAPYIIALSQDVTDRKAQLEALRLREKALDQLDVGLTITDARIDNHPLVYVNKTICDLTGYTENELLGVGVRILQRNNQRQPEHEKIEKAQAQGKPIQVVFKSTRKDGTQYMDELSLSPIHDSSGELTHYIGVNRDVTDKVNMEARLRQTEKIEAIGQLSGGVAHDFNNLLSVISGNLELLAMDLTDPEQLDTLNDAIGAAKMGERLTRRLLTFTRQKPLEASVIAPNEYIEGAMELLRSTIGESISLTASLAPDVWKIHADPSEVENTIVNLVINARDAITDNGRIKVESRNLTLDEDDLAQHGLKLEAGDYVKLSVSDTGCGMTESVKAKIFEPFFTTKEPGTGTGLGLASIYGFVTQCGGWVNVYSEVDEGTIVNVYLPRFTSESAESISGETEATVENNASGNILVVEDNEKVKKVTLKRLKLLGYTTRSARNGPDAVKILEDGAEFDLVFSDVVMDGGMSGYDVAQWVLENRPECKVLLTSGFSQDMASHAVTESAVLQLLQKPYSLTELQRAVEQTLLSN